MISLRNILGGLMLNSGAGTGAEAGEKATTTSNLLRLPPEIILLVTSNLSTPSASCLALCSRRLKHILGPRFWRSLHEQAPDVRLEFLSSLVRDLPQYFVCQECVCLHQISAVKWPRLVARPLGPRCVWKSRGYGPIFWSPYRIYFPHIQLAIKQHCCGTGIGFPPEAFRHLEVELDPIKQKLTLLSIDAQIVSNELLVRSQTWTLLPWSQRNDFIDELAKHSLLNDICVHTRRGPSKRNLVSDMVRSRLGQLETGEKYRTQTLQCPYCWLDYVFDVLDFGERGFAVLITRWANLGSGLDPADAKWQSHITVRMARRDHHPHQPGDIRTGFEDLAEVSVEALTADNQEKLFSRRRNRPVRRGSDDLVWKWDRGKRWYLAPSGPPEMSFWTFLTSS